MGKSFVIIVLEVLLQRSVLRIPFPFVDVSLSSELSSEKGGTMRIVHKSADDLFPTASSPTPIPSACLLLHPSIHKRSNVDCKSLFLSIHPRLLTFDA
jgi:hypothetical protein